MDRLDACYFCGTAADAPLREVSISPRDRQGDPESAVRVTLCPSCEGKLERVLGGLFDHVESRRVEPTESTGADESPADGPSGDESADSADPVDRIDVPSDDPAERQGRRRLFTEPAGADASDESDESGESADTADEDAEIIDDEPRVRARATSPHRDALDGVSVDEYNRVMRLLQNRAFPVARETFVDIASDAYDLGDETVEQVLEAAIEGGALAEREGQLVPPGEEPP